MKLPPGLLKELGDDGGLLTGLDVTARASGIYSPEPIAADAILRPETTAQVAKILAACHEHHQPVITHGGLTGLVNGALTNPGDVVLSTERLKQREEVDVAGRTITVQAGVTLQAVQEAAEQAGLQFALDLGARGSCSIGGNLATNAGGNRVIRYGMAREQVLGLEVVLADGTVLSSMNHMLKNNAAYDLKQLFIGSEGTLGVITRAVLRLRELPASECTALVACESLQQVVSLLKHADQRLGGTLSAFEVMWNDFYRLVTSPPAKGQPPIPQDSEYYVLLDALGGNAHADQRNFEAMLSEALEQGYIIDAAIAQSGRDRDALWALRDDVDQTYNEGPAITFDVSLPVANMEAYVEEVRSNLQNGFGEHFCWIFGHLADGNLHIVVAAGADDGEVRERTEAAVYEPLEKIGGSVSAEHGIGLEKKPWLHLCRSEAEIATMKRLKSALDPRGILNPGKIF